VERPGTGAVADFGFAHPIEKELQKPGSSGQRTEKVVAQQRRFFVNTSQGQGRAKVVLARTPALHATLACGNREPLIDSRAWKRL